MLCTVCLEKYKERRRQDGRSVYPFMKKALSYLLAAVLMGTVALCTGCQKQTVAEPSTEGVVTEIAGTAQADDAQDLALPNGEPPASTTAPLVTKPTTTKAFKESPIIQAIAGAQNATKPATTATTAAQVEEPTTVTAEEPQPEDPTTTTTTKPAASPDMLNNYVLKYIHSGTYTETISAFGNDHSKDDKLTKVVRGGQTAYSITIPAAGLTFKTFPLDGKYYLATPTKYCELTKAQYDNLCGCLGNAFCNFDALQYQKTETVREGFRTSTCEYFDMNGNTLILWFSKNALTKMQLSTSSGTESLPMSVTGSADSAYFTLNTDLEKVDYAALESLVSLATLFFGA